MRSSVLREQKAVTGSPVSRSTSQAKASPSSRPVHDQLARTALASDLVEEASPRKPVKRCHVAIVDEGDDPARIASGDVVEAGRQDVARLLVCQAIVDRAQACQDITFAGATGLLHGSVTAVQAA